MKGQIVPRDFERASPLGKIPALQVNDFCIADSAVISAFLDKQFSTGTPLYPSNPQEYARTLWFERYADVTLADITYKKIFFENIIKPALLGQTSNKEMVEYAVLHELPPMLDYVSESMANNSWIAGDYFSIADIAITVQLLALKTAGIELTEDKWLNLRDYLKRITNRQSFRNII